jgi:perosamine synthetase
VQIPIAKPQFHKDDMTRIQDALDRGWVGMGPYVASFEAEFARYTQASGAVSCSSGTTALHLALAAAQIQPGDEVIVPSFTWVASVNAVLYLGAVPVLCDIDLDTYALCPMALERAITKRTKAIMPVHLFGGAAPMKIIMEIAAQHELLVIEDAACALGTLIDGVHAGCIGDFGTFSFHPRKVITTGEGGMVIAAHQSGLETLKALRNHGITADGDVAHLGFNYRLSDVQGAIGVGQLELLPRFLKDRNEQAERYQSLLKDVPGLITPSVPTDTTHAFQAYVCRLTTGGAGRRDALMTHLATKGIQTRPGTHAVHRLEWHQSHLDFDAHKLTQSDIAHDQTLALPIFPGLSEAAQHHVTDELKQALNRS